MASFYIHGPKVINGYTVYAVTEGKENGTVWALCPTKEYADKIAGLLEASRIQDEARKERDFDTRFERSWQNTRFSTLNHCIRHPCINPGMCIQVGGCYWKH